MNRRNPLSRHLPLRVVILSLLCAIASTLYGEPPVAPSPAPAPQVAATSEASVTRVHDVRDLVLDPVDSSAAQPDPQKPGSQPIDDLSKLIQQAIGPDTWRETGGSIGSIRALNGLLVISQTAENQAKIAAFLADLRKSKGPTLRVRAHWVLCDRSALSGILKPITIEPGGLKAGESSALMAAASNELEQLPNVQAHYYSEVVCLNGQRSSVVDTHSPGDAPVGVPGNPGAQTGLQLEIQAALAPGQQLAQITIRSDWTARPTDSPQAPAPPAEPRLSQIPLPPAFTPRLETRSLVHNQKINASLCLPLGKMILVGGGPVDVAELPSTTPPAADVAKRAHTDPQLYLFVEVTKG